MVAALRVLAIVIEDREQTGEPVGLLVITEQQRERACRRKLFTARASGKLVTPPRCGSRDR
jgi:hypothetical protein